jgi:plastocyanin
MRKRVALLVALAALATSACSGSDEPPECTDPVDTTSVDMTDFDYAPGCIEASDGETLAVSNSGDVLHTFTVRDTDIDVRVDPASKGQVTIDGLTSGSVYRVVCTLHSNMSAALKIA